MAQANCSFQIISPQEPLVEHTFDEIQFEVTVNNPNDQYVIEGRGMGGFRKYYAGPLKPDAQGKLTPPPIRENGQLKFAKGTIYLDVKKYGSASSAYCPLVFKIVAAGKQPYSLCQGNSTCESCQKDGGSWTALGCIPTKDTTALVAWILARAIGIGGGVALILIIIGAFQIITSGGDPEKIKAAGGKITHALIGFLIIFLSYWLVQILEIVLGIQIF